MNQGGPIIWPDFNVFDYFIRDYIKDLIEHKCDDIEVEMQFSQLLIPSCRK